MLPIGYKFIGNHSVTQIYFSGSSKTGHGIFKDYHLRIAQVIRDYGMFERKEALADSRQYHDGK